MSRKKLLGVDFDGTIAEHAYPEIGEPLPYAFEVMKELQAAGYGLILVTCREDEPRRQFLTEAITFCDNHGVQFRSVNCNLPEDDFRLPGGRKVFANHYIDDRNIGGFPGWLSVREQLLCTTPTEQLRKEMAQVSHCVRCMIVDCMKECFIATGKEPNVIWVTPQMELALAIDDQLNMHIDTTISRVDLRKTITLLGMKPIWDATDFKLCHDPVVQEILDNMDPRIKD